MIKFVSGNVLEANTQAIVNTVNCVGVMGKGLALQVKNKHPLVYEQYRHACNQKIVKPGKIFVTLTFIDQPKYVFNFPTKRHWRSNSLVEDIQLGLNNLVDCINDYQISSIAIPALGCCNGGLDWKAIRPLIVSNLQTVADDVLVLIYEPLN
jgi:O-acetyl-ADP-ribose deacetylase (regulator of RNase III)